MVETIILIFIFLFIFDVCVKSKSLNDFDEAVNNAINDYDKREIS